MVSITTTVTTITKMVRSHMVAVPIELIVGQPTLPAVRTVVKQIAAFVEHFNTTRWASCYGYLPLFLNHQKMRLVATNDSLSCAWLQKPALVHPKIANVTKGRDLVQLQEDQKLR